MTTINNNLQTVSKIAPAKIARWQEAANGSVLVSATLVASALDHMLNTGPLGSKASGNGPSLINSMSFYSFIPNVFKGNMKEPLSTKAPILSKLGTIGGYAVVAFITDVIAFLIFPKSHIVGMSTLNAGLMGLGHATKILSAKNLEKRTNNLEGKEVDPTDVFVENENKVISWIKDHRGQFINTTLLFVASIGAASLYQVIDIGSPSSIFISTTFSQVYSKIVKEMIKTGETRCAKLSAVVSSLVIATFAALAVGALAPFDDKGKEGLTLLGNLAYHYLGPVAAIALSTTSTNLVIRAFQKHKVKDKTQAPKVKKEKKVSYLKPALNAGLFPLVTAGTAIAHGINNVYFGGSKVVALTIKLCQAGYGFHTAREVMKAIKNSRAAQVAVMVCIVAIGALVEYASSQLDPTRLNPTHRGDSDWVGKALILGITAGTAATFLGKMVRKEIMEKPRHLPAPCHSI